jgi:endonuclease-3 related protein
MIPTSAIEQNIDRCAENVEAVAGSRLLHVYRLLEAAYGSDRWHWTPATPRAELCMGAILVQHTAWGQVKRALERLKVAGALSFEAVRHLSVDALSDLVRPAGTPLSKARCLKALAVTIDHECAGNLDRFLALPTAHLHAALLATVGIGKETADAIALYAGGKPVFVIDNYTRRLFTRLGVVLERNSYDDWQRWFQEGLVAVPKSAACGVPTMVSLYQSYHAFIVLHGKKRCHSRPVCFMCPLDTVCCIGLSRKRIVEKQV